MAEEKRYCRGSGKRFVFRDGGEILNISIVPSQLVEYLEQVNKERVAQGEKESDFLNIQVAERKTPGEWGDTHYTYVRPYKKFVKRDEEESKPRSKAAPKKGAKKGENEMPWDD